LGLGLGIGGRSKNRYWFVGALLGMIVLLLLLPACTSNSSTVTPNQGTASGTYVITVTGGAGTAAAHQAICTLYVT
jgi:ABC-type Fe3+-hydroxamate transport system substrate-binding protein